MTSDIDLLDIRPGGRHAAQLDGPEALDVASRLVVVDDSTASGDNHARYERLARLSHLRDVVLVVIGPITPDERGRPVLRQSAALGRTSVTLWIGDEHGTRWEGGSDHGRKPEPGAESSVDDLLAVLRSRQVFDEVVRLVRQIPHQAASPALDVVHPSVRPAELTTMLLRDLRQMSGVDDQGPGPDERAPLELRLPNAVSPVERGSRLDHARSVAGQRLADAARAVVELRRWNGAWWPGGSDVRDRLERAAAAVEEHQRLALEAVRLVERLPVPDDEGLVGLGVPRPAPVDHRAVATALSGLLARRLRAGGSLPGAGRALRHVANLQAEQDVDTAPFSAPVVLRRPDPPGARPWRVVAAVLPAVLLTCFLTTWMPDTGLPVGFAGAVLWLALTALLLIRGPSTGMPTTPLLTAVGAVAAAGVAAGALLAPPRGIPPTAQVVLGVVCLVVSLIVLGALWRVLTGRWAATLTLSEGRAANERITRIVDEGVVARQANAELRRRVADAALLLAVGCDDVRDVFATACGDDLPDDRAGGRADLLEVMHRDLELISSTAVEDYLTAIASGVPLVVAPDLVTDRARTLLDEYMAHLGRFGVHRQPPVGDADARADIGAAFWLGSTRARRVLRSTGREDMLQLCGIGDLRRLNPDWSGMRVVRFAPEHLQVSFGLVGEEITGTDRDIVGLLRLVPLRAGVVQRVQPTMSGQDDPLATTWRES